MGKRINTILLSTILFLMIAGPIIYFFILGNDGEKNAEKSIDDIISLSVDVKDVTTNLGSGDIIQISIKIQADGKKAKQELEKRNFQVNNVLIKHLSSLEVKDLASSEGKSNLENDLKDQFNELLSEGQVEKVYITSIIIQ